jgi:hypothetical protein
MNPLQGGLLGVAVAGLAWLSLTPGEPRGPAVEALRRAPAGNKVDAAGLVLAQWRARERFGVFPAADPTAVAQADAGALRLQGTSSSPARKAVLISVGGAKPQWLVMGEPAGGLELMELDIGRAVVRTTSGDTVTLQVFSPARPPGSDTEAGANATN